MGVTLYYSYVFFEIFYQSNNHQRHTNVIQFYDTIKWHYDFLLNIHETLIFQSNSPPLIHTQTHLLVRLFNIIKMFEPLSLLWTFFIDTSQKFFSVLWLYAIVVLNAISLLT